MRILSLLLLLSGSVQAGGLLSRLLSRGEPPKEVFRPGVKMLELEIVQRPARVVASEFAKLQFRVRQLTNPDPQFAGPPVRLRRYAPSGTQFEHQWIHANNDGIYEAFVPMRDSQIQYLYFETGDDRTILVKVPWIVLEAAE
jgi:hypothetical protein